MSRLKKEIKNYLPELTEIEKINPKPTSDNKIPPAPAILTTSDNKIVVNNPKKWTNKVS